MMKPTTMHTEKQEDSTEFSESSMIELTVASPQNNDEIISQQVDYQSPKRRVARVAMGVLIMGGIIGACVGVLSVLAQKDPDLGDSEDTAEQGLPSCTRDSMFCPDGTMVTRVPGLNCEFAPCPESPQQQQQQATTEDPVEVSSEEGSTITEQSPLTEENTTTTVQEEEEPVLCGREIKMCTDLSTVTRTGTSCEFEACPAGACMVDTYVCPNGVTYVGRDPNNGCAFNPCPN